MLDQELMKFYKKLQVFIKGLYFWIRTLKKLFNFDKVKF
jgi:hypothetical protein